MKLQALLLTAAVLCGLAALPAKATPIDLGLCPTVDKALDPNGDGDFSDGSNTAALAAANACAEQDKGMGLLSKAYVLRRLQQPVEAQAAIEAGLAAGGDQVVGLRMQCALYSDAGKYDLGRETCGKAIAAGPSRPLGYLGLGNLEFNAGQWAAAVAAYDGALQRGSDDTGILVAKGQALNNLGKRAAALVAFQTAQIIAPRDMEARTEAIWTLQAMGDNQKAIAAADEALLIDPKAWNVQRWKGRAYENLSRWPEAFAAYDAAARLNPKSAPVVWDRGTMHEKLGRQKEALADYSQAIVLDPKFSDAYQYRGNLLLAQNQPEAAFADLNKAIELSPQNARYLNSRAALLMKFGKAAEAQSDLQKAIKLDAKFADAYSNLAIIAYRTKNYPAAVSARTQELRIDPTSQPALFWRAKAYGELNKADEAIADYTALLKLNPNYLWAYNNRGQLLLDKDDCNAAQRDFDVVTRRMPGLGGGWVGSAICASRQDDDGAAFWAANQDRWQTAPATTDKYLAMAYFSASLQRFDAAILMANKAKAINPNDPEVKNILDALGKHDQAEVDSLFSALDDLADPEN